MENSIVKEKQSTSRATTPMSEMGVKEKESAINKEISVPRKSSAAKSHRTTTLNKESTENTKVESTSTSTKSSFSLMNIMNQQNQPTTSVDDSNKENNQIKRQSVNISKPEEKNIPKWMFDYPQSDRKMEGDIDRWLAMKFLSQAVRYFPHDKQIDYNSIACALEDTIFKHLGKNCEEYWDRVHDICGALVGKKSDGHKHVDTMGHLARKIIAGEYQSPLEIIKIPKKVLLQSYEGHWIA